MSPIILLPRTTQCDEVNGAMLQQLEEEIINLPAIDTRDTVVNKQLLPKVEEAYRKLGDDVTRTGGLKDDLKLCIGAKVMLKRNVSVEAGLVNGSVGTVSAFTTRQTDNGNHITSVTVKFDKIETPINIERQSCSFEVLRGIFYTRKQFPLILAFAITIHKSQGLSLNSAIIDAGANCFGSGMTYVALSRVTTLTGLHLIDFDPAKISCNRKAVAEYNRLRSIYTPHLGELQTMSKRHQITEPTDSSKQTCSSTKKQKKQKTETTVLKKGPVAEAEHDGLAGTDGTVQLRMFDCCAIESVTESFQAETCQRLNLQLFPTTTVTTSPPRMPIARKLDQYLHTQTNTRTAATIVGISGSDGNCLFRALSYAITRNQSQHHIIRQYIVNHMTNPTLQESFKTIFTNEGATNEMFLQHLQKMQTSGEWGTEMEIIAAAHLFQCAILCFSRYNRTKFCLQQFSPHFLDTQTCSPTCNHKSLYLINTSGSHYDLALVKLQSHSLLEE